MLTLEVYRTTITWPEDFAQMMMRHYRQHGVPFTVRSGGAPVGPEAAGDGISPAEATAATESRAAVEHRTSGTL